MKKFSNKWKSSRKPRKQRKYQFNAPLHSKYKFLAAKLSKELAKKYEIKRIEARKGDKVKLMRGQFSGTIGKINRVNISETRIYIDGVERTKIDGSKAFYPVHPSNVMIVDLAAEDKRRFKRNKK